MSSGLERLVGLQLERCRFSSASYEFEFDGVRDGGLQTYVVGTNYNVCVLPSQSDARETISAQIWPLFSQSLVGVYIDEISDARQVVFEFEGGDRLRVWQDGDATDNLLIVTERPSGSWFAVL